MKTKPLRAKLLANDGTHETHEVAQGFSMPTKMRDERHQWWVRRQDLESREEHKGWDAVFVLT